MENKEEIIKAFETIKDRKFSFNFSDPEYIKKNIEEIETNSILLAEFFVKCRTLIINNGDEGLLKLIYELKELDILSKWLEKYYMDGWTVAKIRNNITYIVSQNKKEMIDIIYFVYKKSNAYESNETESANEELIAQEHKFV